MKKKTNLLKTKRLHLAIGYFAKYLYEKTKKYPNQLDVYTFLTLIDFTSVKERGKPVFGLEYQATQQGPIPVEIDEEIEVENRENFKYFTIRSIDNSTKEFIPTSVNDIEKEMDWFAKSEQELIKRLAELLTNKENSMSYQNLKAWEKAINRSIDHTMNYLDEIEDEYLREIFNGYLEIQELENQSYTHEENKNDTYILSESSLKKDWLTQEEDKVWENL